MLLTECRTPGELCHGTGVGCRIVCPPGPVRYQGNASPRCRHPTAAPSQPHFSPLAVGLPLWRLRVRNVPFLRCRNVSTCAHVPVLPLLRCPALCRSKPGPSAAPAQPHALPGPGPVLGLVNFLATALVGMEAEGRQLLWGPLIIPLRQAALITSGKKFIRAAALTTFICAAGSDSLGSQIKAMMGPDEIHCLFILCDLIHLPIHHLPCGIPPGPAPAPPFPSRPAPVLPCPRRRALLARPQPWARPHVQPPALAPGSALRPCPRAM